MKRMLRRKYAYYKRRQLDCLLAHPAIYTKNPKFKDISKYIIAHNRRKNNLSENTFCRNTHFVRKIDFVMVVSQVVWTRVLCGNIWEKKKKKPYILDEMQFWWKIRKITIKPKILIGCNSLDDLPNKYLCLSLQIQNCRLISST